MIVFVDFEASSLGPDSYPIEVGWAFEDGRCEAHLIRPAPAWTDWDPLAEAIHGLARGELLARGEAHDVVARRVLEALSPHRAFASAPSWDGNWLSVLLRAAGLPRHAMRLADAGQAHLQAARDGLAERMADPGLVDVAAAALVTDAQAAMAQAPVRHRALADAQQELALWREVGRLAAAHGS